MTVDLVLALSEF